MTNPKSTKVCTKCGIERPLHRFSRHKSTKDGLHTRCKSCVSDYNKWYREKNKASISAYLKQYRINHGQPEERAAPKSPEEIRARKNAYAKQCYQENRGGVREKKRLYRKQNAERQAEYARKWRAEHKEYLAEQNKKYRQENGDKRRAAHAKRKALKKGATGEVGADIIYQMAEDQDWLCAYCEMPLFGEFHVDHMIPLSRGGRHDWSNLAITCPTCNMAKHTKTAEEFIC